MATTESNKDLIDELTTKMTTLSTHRRKLPAKPPATFTYGAGDFKKFSQKVCNYLKTMAVSPDDRVQCLLTYLDSKSYSMVTRVYSVEQLKTQNYETATGLIAGLLTIAISETDATRKLINIKQGSLEMLEYIAKLEQYADLAFPAERDKQAREKCIKAALISGAKSGHLKFELQKFRKDGNGDDRSFSDMCLKAVELETLISKDDTDTGEEFVFEVDEKPSSSVTQSHGTRKCFVCDSDQHLKAQCPQKPTRISNYRPENKFNNNFKPQSYRNNQMNRFQFSPRRYNGASNNNAYRGQNYYSRNNSTRDNFGRQFNNYSTQRYNGNSWGQYKRPGQYRGQYINSVNRFNNRFSNRGNSSFNNQKFGQGQNFRRNNFEKSRPGWKNNGNQPTSQSVNQISGGINTQDEIVNVVEVDSVSKN